MFYSSLVFLIYQEATGQNTHSPIIFDHYGLNQGFSASQVLCLEKTKDGYLWLGTEQGLIRYDGHNFKAFRSNPLDSTTISSNYVRKIMEDKHDRLWVSALPDLNVFDTQTGKCKRISIPIDIDSEKKLDIRCFKYDEGNDVMWFGTNKGLLYTQGEEINLHQEMIPGKDAASGIYSIEIDDSGIFWLAANDGLWRYDPTSCDTKTFHRPVEDPNIPFVDGFFSSYFDKRNNIIWIGGWVHGLMKFDIATEKMSNYTFADYTVIQNGIFTIQQSGLYGEKELLWLGTTDGVKTFNIANNTFYDYNTKDINDIKAIQGAGFCFEPTKTEGMWIGTYRGLHRYDPFKQNVKVIDIPLTHAQADWTLGNICFESESKKDSIIWFGIGYQSFFRFDILNKRQVAVPSDLKPYCDVVQPYTLYIDSRNILWLSSYKKGLVGYDLTAKKLIIPKLNIGQKEKPNILKIVEDSDKNLWLGSTNGMYLYLRERNEIVEHADIRQFLDREKLSDHAFRFTIDSERKVWIFSTQKYEEGDALYCFDPRNKSFRLFTQNEYPVLKILRNLEDVESISKHKLIITSFNGFCIVNTSTTTPNFELFETYNEKPLGLLKKITKDNEGYVWMASDNGVNRFDPETSTISSFTYSNSNIGITPNSELSFSDKTNTIYLSQNLAINSISVNDLKMAKPENLILSDMKIIDYKYEILPNSGQTLHLNYNQNSIEFQFTNLSFTNSQNNEYKYKLDGTQSDWKAMTGNDLKFDNLGYGFYSLKVKATNSFGLKSPNEFVLYMDISPPFWRTWWFNGFIIASISLLIYSFFKYRDVQRQKVENLRLAIARDLHDEMGSSLSHIRMLSEREAMRSKDQTAYSTIAQKTGEVMNSMSEIIWSINPKYESLQLLFGKIQEFAIDTLESQGINVDFNVDEIPTSIKLSPEDRRHYYLILKEAINNTAKYSKAKNVSLSLEIKPKHFITSIMDDGIGFDPLLISKGNGLKNIEARANLLGGELKINTSQHGTTIDLLIKM